MRWSKASVEDRAGVAIAALWARGDGQVVEGSVPAGCDNASVVTRDLIIWFTAAGEAPAADVARALGVPAKQVHRVLARLAPWHPLGPTMLPFMSRGQEVPPGTQAGWYSQLRTDGWPWRRAGRLGNRGGGARRATCRSSTTPPSTSSG